MLILQGFPLNLASFLLNCHKVKMFLIVFTSWYVNNACNWFPLVPILIKDFVKYSTYRLACVGVIFAIMKFLVTVPVPFTEKLLKLTANSLVALLFF